jgi:hypothetical protein
MIIQLIKEIICVKHFKYEITGNIFVYNNELFRLELDKVIQINHPEQRIPLLPNQIKHLQQTNQFKNEINNKIQTSKRF